MLAGLAVVLAAPHARSAQQTFPDFGSVPKALYDIVQGHVQDIVLKEDVTIAGVTCAPGPARAAYALPRALQALLQCRLAAPFTEIDFTIPVASVVDVRAATEGGHSRMIGAKLGADTTYKGFPIARGGDVDMIGGKLAFKTSQPTTLPDGLVLPPATFVVFPTTLRLPSFALPTDHVFGRSSLPPKTWVMVELGSTMTLRGFTANTDFTLGNLPVKTGDSFVVWNGEDYETQLGNAPRNQPADQFLGLTLKPGDQLHLFNREVWVVRLASDRKLSGLELKKGDAFSIDEKTQRIEIVLRHDIRVGGDTYPAGSILDINAAGGVIESLRPPGAPALTTRQRAHAVATRLRAMIPDETKYADDLRSTAQTFRAAAASSSCARSWQSISDQVLALATKVAAVAAQWVHIADKIDAIADTHPEDYELDDYAITMQRYTGELATMQSDERKELAGFAPPTDACRRYPVPILASHDFGAYHMITRGQLQRSGLLLLKTEINEHRALAGDCGKPFGYAYDKDGNELLRFEGTRSCVDGTHMGWIAGPSVRLIEWSAQIPNVDNVAAIVIYHMNDAPPPLEKLNATIAAVRQFAKDNPEVVEVIAASM